jgi:hypothetical protein
MIKSEQIPEERVIELVKQYPKLAEFLTDYEP